MSNPLDALFRLNRFVAPRASLPRPHDVASFLIQEGLSARHVEGRVMKNSKR